MAELRSTHALANRLTRHFAACATAAVAAPFLAADCASAAVQYTSVSWNIPANIDGLYINVETLATGSAGSVVAGWDINPYSATSLTWFNATGTGMMRFPGLTTGSAGNLAPGTIVGPTGSFGSGAVTVGSAAGNWQLNAANKFGFRFVAADGLTHYGWGTMVVGAAITTRTITEIAWETTAATPIAVGDTGAGSGPYDPCAATNPTISSGANNLFVRSTDIADLDLGACGIAYNANYYKFTSATNRNYDISTCAGASSSILAVLDGCAAGSGVVACGTPCGTGSSLTLSATAGGVYYVVLGSADPLVDLPTAYTVSVTPWYDPCDSTNPVLGNANSSVAYNSATAENLVVGSCGFVAYKANYYKYTPAATGEHTFNTCGGTDDTRMAVLDGCGAGAAVLGCNDNSCGSGASVTVSLTSGVPVYVAVGSASPKVSLASPIVVTTVPPPLPACVDAVAATYGDNAISNSGLTDDPIVYTNALQTTFAEVWNAQWLAFTPTATGQFTIKACGAGDTRLAIGTICPGVGGRFSTIAYSDDAPTCLTTTGATTSFGSWIDATNNGATGTFAGFPLTQDLVAGTTYYIAVGGFGSTDVVSGFLNIAGPEAPDNPADLNGDGVVGPADLAVLLGNWDVPGAVGDINGDGNVGAADLAALLAAWSA